MHIKIEADDDGKLILSEDIKYKVDIEVDEELLKEVQALIDEYKLAELNGICKYTSALPPPYLHMQFEARYESGEKIFFLYEWKS